MVVLSGSESEYSSMVATNNFVRVAYFDGCFAREISAWRWSGGGTPIRTSMRTQKASFFDTEVSIFQKSKSFLNAILPKSLVLASNTAQKASFFDTEVSIFRRSRSPF